MGGRHLSVLRLATVVSATRICIYLHHHHHQDPCLYNFCLSSGESISIIPFTLMHATRPLAARLAEGCMLRAFSPRGDAVPLSCTTVQHKPKLNSLHSTAYR